jgi:plasmid stabilization system protein ParE
MVRIIEWSIDAQISRRAIFNYWNNRNKSKVYIRKLNKQFLESLNLICNFTEIGKPTDISDVKIRIESHFELIYKISDSKLTVIEVFDTRQNHQIIP